MRGFNHHGTRNAKINKEIAYNRCLRCNEIENWDHKILCPGTRNMQQEYMRDLKKDLTKIKDFQLLVTLLIVSY